MPLMYGKDNEGCYVKYGKQGHHYYYKCNSDIAKENAKQKAIAQGVAIGDFNNLGPIKTIQLKKWRNTADSSNVDKMMFNDETNELVIKFNDGSIYTYFNIDFTEFMNVVNGNAVCRTSGDNRWGSWDVGKSPSVGAAVWKYLIDKNVDYREGGTLR